mgnify:CR=1 FL=1
MELEASSSEIRIESEGESEEARNNIVSTKSYRHRSRVDSKDMDGNAGLEISSVSSNNGSSSFDYLKQEMVTTIPRALP